MVLYLGWFWLLLEARGRSSLGPRCLLMVMSLIPPAPGPSYLRRQPKKVCLNNSSDMGGQRRSPSLGNLLKNLLSLTTPESGTRQGLRSKPGVLCVPGTLLLCRFAQAARLNQVHYYCVGLPRLPGSTASEQVPVVPKWFSGALL